MRPGRRLSARPRCDRDVAAAISTGAAAKARTEPSGQEIYRAECARCHGLDGRGDGPDSVYFSPRPRDLTAGFLEKYSSEDLVARIKNGTPLVIEIYPEAVRKRLHNVEEIVVHVKASPVVLLEEGRRALPWRLRRALARHRCFPRRAGAAARPARSAVPE